MRLKNTCEKSMQALAKEGLFKGVKTCKLKFCEHCVINKKTKVKFGITIHCNGGFLIIFTQMFGGLPGQYLLEVTIILCSLLMIL